MYTTAVDSLVCFSERFGRTKTLHKPWCVCVKIIDARFRSIPMASWNLRSFSRRKRNDSNLPRTRERSRVRSGQCETTERIKRPRFSPRPPRRRSAVASSEFIRKRTGEKCFFRLRKLPRPRYPTNSDDRLVTRPWLYSRAKSEIVSGGKRRRS